VGVRAGNALLVGLNQVSWGSIPLPSLLYKLLVLYCLCVVVCLLVWYMWFVTCIWGVFVGFGWLLQARSVDLSRLRNGFRLPYAPAVTFPVSPV